MADNGLALSLSARERRDTVPVYDGDETFSQTVESLNIIERAFELACRFRTVEEVRKALRREGYSNVDAHLSGASIKADLKKRFGH
jgi:hypothetical protein